MRHSLLSALVAASVIVPTAHAGIVITEVMSSSGTNGTPDWFEVTNDGSSAVSLSGWKMDDGSFNLAAAVALSGITSIGAGESVIFIESTGGAGIGSFRTFWGGLANVQVGYYSGSGVGLSSGGDGVCLFNNLGVNVNQVSFGAATTGSSFFWGWDAQGSIDPNYSAVVSTVGTIGTQVGFVSADALGNVGSLGTAIAVPGPGVAAAAVLALAVRSRRRA
jgi:predicted extracellular nuclease